MPLNIVHLFVSGGILVCFCFACCVLVCVCQKKDPLQLNAGAGGHITNCSERYVGNFCKFLAKLPAFNRRERVKCLLVFWHVFKKLQNVLENVRYSRTC